MIWTACRFTADVSGDNSGRRSSGRSSWDRDSGRDGRYLSDRVRDSLPDRVSHLPSSDYTCMACGPCCMPGWLDARGGLLAAVQRVEQTKDMVTQPVVIGGICAVWLKLRQAELGAGPCGAWETCTALDC